MIFGIILGGLPPYGSMIDFYSPLLVTGSLVLIAYSAFAALGRRAPVLLDGITAAICAWVLAGICDAKFQQQAYSYPWTRFGCRDITGCVEAGIFTVLVTMAFIRSYEKSGYSYASEKGMILGFFIGWIPMHMILAPIT